MKKVVRSYNGCQKCRSLKKKCSEEKPQCSNCKKQGYDCSYVRPLKWGGRPFKDKRVTKMMRFEHTYVVEGICAVDLKAATGKNSSGTASDSKVAKNKKKKKNSRAEMGAQQMLLQMPLQPLQQQQQTSFPEAKIVEYLPQVDVEVKVDVDENSINIDPSVGGESFSPLSALFDNSNTERSPTALDTDQLVFQPNAANTAFSSEVVLQNQQFMSPTTRLPSFMIPDLLLQSPELAESFDFFFSQTSKLLVPAPSTTYSRNPFFNFLPRMAMNSSALMNLLLVFGANHKHKIMHSQGFYTDGNSSLVANDLLTNTFTSLLTQLTDFDTRNSDSTLATILLLAAFDIFFGDKKQKWRTHVYGARKIMKERLSNGTGALTLSDHSADFRQEHFLLRWFAYTDIISSLSSTNSINNIHKLSSLKYEMETNVEDSLMQKMIRLEDIEYFTGMEVSCLWMLAEVSRLVNEKETDETTVFPQVLVLKALELDHKMTTYLKKTELKRDEVYQTYYLSKTDAVMAERYEVYRILRGTNQIFTLTGVLQLKRRVLGISPSSPIIIELLKEITKIIENCIAFESSAETCIIFCIFSCGCELMDPELYEYRLLYQQHLTSLVRKGVTSAKQAQNIMEECWLSGKQWWDLFKEKNMDITFAL